MSTFLVPGLGLPEPPVGRPSVGRLPWCGSRERQIEIQIFLSDLDLDTGDKLITCVQC